MSSLYPNFLCVPTSSALQLADLVPHEVARCLPAPQGGDRPALGLGSYLTDNVDSQVLQSAHNLRHRGTLRV